MKFRVTDTEPGFKGNSVTNIYKGATIETGAEVKVPLFVGEGESIIVNTETGEYVERTKQGK
jgi:elongation factor P